jgi:MarR family 2-MHQ and catechol resistance regulon transcriptional repressor
LSTSQFGVLESLYHLGPMCQSELATKILKSTGNLTMVVDHLEQRGLVERQRDSSDRRFITVHLTGAGETLIAGMFAEHAAGVAREFAVLTAAEQEQLALLCRKLGKGGEDRE